MNRKKDFVNDITNLYNICYHLIRIEFNILIAAENKYQARRKADIFLNNNRFFDCKNVEIKKIL